MGGVRRADVLEQLVLTARNLGEPSIAFWVMSGQAW